MSTAERIETEPEPRFAWDTLAKLLAVVEHAASKDERRYNLNSILLERVGESLAVTATATDGHRLCQATTAIDPAALPLPPKGFLLRLEDAARIRAEAKLLGKGRRNGFAEAVATLEGDVLVIRERIDSETAAELRCKAQEGEFPDYRQVIPDPEKLGPEVAFNAKYLGEVAKAFGAVNERSHSLTVRLADAVSPARLEVKHHDMEAFEVLMTMRL